MDTPTTTAAARVIDVFYTVDGSIRPSMAAIASRKLAAGSRRRDGLHFDSVDIQDAVQEACLRVLRAQDEGRINETIEGYAATTLRNYCIDMQRQAAGRPVAAEARDRPDHMPVATDGVTEHQLADQAPTPCELAWDRAAVDMLLAATEMAFTTRQKLAKQAARVLILCHGDEETALALLRASGASRTAAYNRLEAARAVLIPLVAQTLN